MSYVMIVQGFADGSECSSAGQFLESFDHDADIGRGIGICTDDIDRAMLFRSRTEALKFWRRQSAVCPIRDDGKPNRPMTAMTVSIERVPKHCTS